MDKQARNAMDCFLGVICKVYVEMTLVLNIPVGSFAVLLKSLLPPQTAKSKTAKSILLRSVLLPQKLPSPFYSK